MSGGAIIEPKAPKRASDDQLPMPPHPMANFMGQNQIGTYFPFPPPINSITAFNPLTLPAKQPDRFSDSGMELSAVPTKSLHPGMQFCVHSSN